MKISKIIGCYILLVAYLFSVASCNTGEADKYAGEKTVGMITYTIQTLPLEAYTRYVSGLDKEQLSEYLYVSMQLKHQEDNIDLIKWQCADEAAYNERLAFFNNRVRQYVYITDGTLQVYPEECIYENSYGISPMIHLVMIFKKIEGVSQEQMKLVFEDQVFTRQIIKFSLKK